MTSRSLQGIHVEVLAAAARGEVWREDHPPHAAHMRSSRKSRRPFTKTVDSLLARDLLELGDPAPYGRHYKPTAAGLAELARRGFTEGNGWCGEPVEI